MTWTALHAEVTVEMRAYADHERADTLAALMDGLARAHVRSKVGPAQMRRDYDRDRQRAETDARAAALLASGDLRALRRLESARRAAKKRGAA